jgi:hypothetical protein
MMPTARARTGSFCLTHVRQVRVFSGTGADGATTTGSITAGCGSADAAFRAGSVTAGSATGGASSEIVELRGDGVATAGSVNAGSGTGGGDTGTAIGGPLVAAGPGEELAASAACHCSSQGGQNAR